MSRIRGFRGASCQRVWVPKKRKTLRLGLLSAGMQRSWSHRIRHVLRTQQAAQGCLPDTNHLRLQEQTDEACCDHVGKQWGNLLYPSPVKGISPPMTTNRISVRLGMYHVNEQLFAGVLLPVAYRFQPFQNNRSYSKKTDSPNVS